MSCSVFFLFLSLSLSLYSFFTYFFSPSFSGPSNSMIFTDIHRVFKPHSKSYFPPFFHQGIATRKNESNGFVGRTRESYERTQMEEIRRYLRVFIQADVFIIHPSFFFFLSSLCIIVILITSKIIFL